MIGLCGIVLGRIDFALKHPGPNGWIHKAQQTDQQQTGQLHRDRRAPAHDASSPAAEAQIEAVHRVLEVFGEEQERTGQQLVLYILHVADLLVHFELDDETLTAAVLYRAYSAGHLDEQEMRENYSETVVKRSLDLARIERLTPGVLAAREEEGEERCGLAGTAWGWHGWSFLECV